MGIAVLKRRPGNSSGVFTYYKLCIRSHLSFANPIYSYVHTDSRVSFEQAQSLQSRVSFLFIVMYCALQVGCQKETDSLYLWLIKIL